MTENDGSAFAKITAALARVGPISRPRLGETRASCPAHEGKSVDSLRITAADGKALVHCFADCETAAVLAALGLSERDLSDAEPIINRRGNSDEGMLANDWISVVRRAALDATTKLVALTVASYASPDGHRVFPGVIRLAVECSLGQRTVERVLAKLRELGLLHRVRRGNRRRGECDEYRLIAARDLLDRLDVLSKDDQRDYIDAVKMRKQRQWRQARGRRIAAESTANLMAVEPSYQPPSGAHQPPPGDVPTSIHHPPLKRDPPAVRAHAAARATTNGHAAINGHRVLTTLPKGPRL